MALDPTATLVVNTGNFYTAPVGTVIPADLDAITTPWAVVGHTSLEDIFSITSDGGDRNVLGTLQNVSLRTKYSVRQESFNFTLQQFDEDALKLYYGSNATILADGSVGVPQNPIPTTVAFLAVFYDGTNTFTFYCPKADVYRADDMSIGDTESLAGLPLQVTPLVHNTNEYTYAVSPLGA